jgi:hypothetical protein
MKRIDKLPKKCSRCGNDLMKGLAMNQSRKHLYLVDHGLTVYTDPSPFTSILDVYCWLCNHWHTEGKEIKTIEEVIEYVESIKQPVWWKNFKLGKFHFSIVKYNE